MSTYVGEWTLREARQRYFERTGIPDGCYDDRWVRLRAGPLVVRFPNTQARVRSVKLHDLHHVLAEYDTTWSGEAQIAAWEIASGCADHYAAWVLNLGAIAIGLFVAPRAVYTAFIRGRKMANLYRGDFNDALLTQTVGAVRDQLGIESTLRRTSWADRIAFVGWALAAVAATFAPSLVAVALVLAAVQRLVG